MEFCPWFLRLDFREESIFSSARCCPMKIYPHESKRKRTSFAHTPLDISPLGPLSWSPNGPPPLLFFVFAIRIKPPSPPICGNFFPLRVVVFRPTTFLCFPRSSILRCDRPPPPVEFSSKIVIGWGVQMSEIVVLLFPSPVNWFRYSWLAPKPPPSKRVFSPYKPPRWLSLSWTSLKHLPPPPRLIFCKAPFFWMT